MVTPKIPGLMIGSSSRGFFVVDHPASVIIIGDRHSILNLALADRLQLQIRCGGNELVTIAHILQKRDTAQDGQIG